MLQNTLQNLIRAAIAATQASGELPAADVPDVTVVQPQRPEHGDFATQVALSLAKPMRRAPREIAHAIAARLPTNDMIESAEVAGPGYVNIRLRPAWLAQQVDRVLAAGAGYADQDLGHGQRAQVEFIS